MDVQVFSGSEEKYVQITKNGKFYQRALCTSFIVYHSLYHTRYHGILNGHCIVDITFAKLDKPNYEVE
jgi:hypothetical protein